MLKQKTADRINGLAKLLIDAFVQDAQYGATTRGQVDELRARVKNPTEIEVVKAMIRTDKGRIGTAAAALGWTGSLSNIMKRSEHFNALANAVSAGIKERAWRGGFRRKYDELFSARRPVQMEFDI